MLFITNKVKIPYIILRIILINRLIFKVKNTNEHKLKEAKLIFKVLISK